MSSNVSYQTELNDYNTQVADYKQRALSLWAGIKDPTEIPRSLAGELGGALGFESAKDLATKALGSKAAQAAKARLLDAGGKLKDIATRAGNKIVDNVTDSAKNLVQDTKAKISTLVDDTRGSLDSIVDKGTGILSDAKGTVEGAASDVTDALSGARVGIENTVGNLGQIADQAATDLPELSQSLAGSLQYAGTRAVGTYDGLATRSLAELKQGNGFFSDLLDRFRSPRVTERGRAALGADEFETGDYSLIDQGPGTTIRSGRFSGLISDGFGNVSSGGQSVQQAASKASAELADTARGAADDVAQVANSTAETLGNTADEVTNTLKSGANDITAALDVADKVKGTVQDIENLTGASADLAEQALTEGATAIRGGSELIGGLATDVTTAVGGAADAAGVAAAEAAGEALDALGPVGDIAGLAVGAGALLYSIFGGHESEPPTVEIPNYSIPVAAPGLD